MNVSGPESQIEDHDLGSAKPFLRDFEPTLPPPLDLWNGGAARPARLRADPTTTLHYLLLLRAA